nr:Nha1 [Starmerella bombicola]
MWAQLSTDDAHVSYACIAFGLIIILSVALFLKHRFDFSEVIIATIFGLIVGPHCIGWFNPADWTQNEHRLTLELARIVMNIQIFAASSELPPRYVWHSAQGLTMLLLPIMTVGYLLNSVFIWGLLPQLRWLESLIIAGCVTATDPVLASAVLSGPGFAQRLPKRLVHILSAESASNDGMALPFVMLPVYILLHEHHAPEIAKDFIVLTVLYQVLFAIVLGAFIGGCGCVLFKYASRRCEFREEYVLIYNVILAIFCAGVGSLLGCDDFLVSFAAGAAFSWSGWVHTAVNDFDVTGFIDLLLNTAFFVYFGSVIPWERFNSSDIAVWRLIVIIILILVGRRIPAIAVFKPLIPEIKSWKEVLIAGHFGPIGVAAIYMCLEAETEIEEMPNVARESAYLLRNMWPVVSFIVLCSVIVHGTSVVIMNLVQHSYSTIILSRAATREIKQKEEAC